jgi:hypothetical protein
MGYTILKVRARVITRRPPQRNHNPTTSLDYFFSPNIFAKKTWKINSYVPSYNVL